MTAEPGDRAPMGPASKIRYLLPILVLGMGLVLSSNPLPAHSAFAQGPLSTMRVATDKTWRVDNRTTASGVRSSCIPSSWYPAAKLQPAYWIWSKPCTATDVESHQFSKTFIVGGSVTSAKLEIACDNYANVRIDGVQVPYPYRVAAASVGAFENPPTLNVTRLLRPGRNTIVIAVHNYPIGSSPGWSNPAGVLARLTIGHKG